MGIHRHLFASCQNIFRTSDIYIWKRDERHHPGGRLRQLLGLFMCLHPIWHIDTRNRTVFDYFQRPQWLLGLSGVQLSCCFQLTVLYLPWCFCVIDLQETWKGPFPLLVAGNWPLYSVLGTNVLAWSHTFNICCRTRCSVQDTTPPTQCDQTCTVPVCCVQDLFC